MYSYMYDSMSVMLQECTFLMPYCMFLLVVICQNGHTTQPWPVGHCSSVIIVLQRLVNQPVKHPVQDLVLFQLWITPFGLVNFLWKDYSNSYT